MSGYRPMKYPYTVTAKVVQFPFRYYVKHSWLFKYCIIASVFCAPIFYKIRQLSHSPANVEKWQAIWEERYGKPWW